MLLQVDGSRHDWLEGRGPRLTLVGAIDDATGRLTGAVFREQEDTAGYLIVLRDTVRRHGMPLAVYRDRHTLFETPRGSLMTLEEQLADTRTPTQLGRAFAELGITSIAARSPQAKGRIERAWGTLQDRLVTELRLAGADDLAERQRGPGPLPAPLRPALRRARGGPGARLATAAGRHPDRAGLLPQVPPGRRQRPHGPGGCDDPPAAAGSRPPRAMPVERVEVQLRLDGRIVVWDGERELLAVPAPADPVQLRALESARRRRRLRRPECRNKVRHHPGPATIPGAGCRSTAGGADPTDRITEQMT